MGMAGLSSWVGENWFNLIQTTGIMGSLLMTAAASHREAKAREIENLLTISAQHRNLWGEAQRRTDLQRIFQGDIDVLKIPATVVEEIFLNEVIVHFQLGWQLSKSGAFIKLGEMQSDVRGFFSLPLPRAVWEKTKKYRNPQFMRFVENALLAVR